MGILLETLLNNIRSDFGRQALINGNFDVWQRGTSVTNPADQAYLADRWKTRISADGGTLPTSIIHSRQALTLGDIFGSYYFYRVNPNGAGTSLGTASYGILEQYSENWIKYLMGAGAKKVTLSFYARSSIANKKFGVQMYFNYGTGGSPSASEAVNGQLWTLTSSWTKYTYTFTLPDLSAKTLGTSGDEYARIRLFYMWGTTNDPSGAGTAETFVGSGNIDIAQVQLSMGDLVPKFYPKTFRQELTDCQRYYQAGSGYSQNSFYCGNVTSGVGYYARYIFPVEMRTTPTVTLTNNGNSGFSTTVGSTTRSSKGFSELRTANGTINGGFFHSNFIADAEL